MLIKPEQQLSEPLKFIFHLSKFRCKMLKENKVYTNTHIHTHITLIVIYVIHYI